MLYCIRFLSNSVCSGVLLPGDVIKFPFIFKSPNVGIFSEQWEFQTHPVVCGGAKLLLTLRGVALKQDKYEEERTELEVTSDMSYSPVLFVMAAMFYSVFF